jgi:hypothetical protein
MLPFQGAYFSFIQLPQGDAIGLMYAALSGRIYPLSYLPLIFRLTGQGRFRVIRFTSA